MKLAVIVVLVTAWPVLVHAQDEPQPPTTPLVITIPPELLGQVQVQLPSQAAPTKPKADLTYANVAAIAAASADWATSFAGCTPSCTTRDLVLPDVSKPGLAIPVGLAVDTFVIWVLNEHVAPRWPKAAQAALYIFSILRSVEADQHVQDGERHARGLP